MIGAILTFLLYGPDEKNICGLFSDGYTVTIPPFATS